MVLRYFFLVLVLMEGVEELNKETFPIYVVFSVSPIAERRRGHQIK